jgi:hypothetical protein
VPGSSEIVRLLRAYPTPESTRWLYLLLETLADLEAVNTRAQLADVVARRTREIFGDAVRGTILVINDETLFMLASEYNADVPSLPVSSAVTIPYTPGIIFEISDYNAYRAQRPVSEVWYEAGFRYIVSSGFGPRTHTKGYVSFLHRSQSEYSDDELTLLAILATFIGIAIDRIDLGVLPQPPGTPAPLPDRPLVSVLRTYPTIDRQPWLFMLLESIADFASASSRQELAHITYVRVQALFGSDVCATMILRSLRTKNIETIRSPELDYIPPLRAPTTLAFPYTGGQIVEIADFRAFCDARPTYEAWYDAGIRYVVCAAFNPRSPVNGYLNFLHQTARPYSDDELSLFAIFASVAGFAVARVDANTEQSA